MINTIEVFDGQHCETTATGTLLKHLGITLSEPMLFGLGEGLSFLYWKMKGMEFPFLGGRIKTDLLTRNICKNLHLELMVKETSSKAKAWKEVKQLLDNGHVVGLKLDAYHLEYFTHPFHFAGHYAAIYGYDSKAAFLVDTCQQGGRVQTSLDSLGRARAAKGPMASKNLYYQIERTPQDIDIEMALRTALINNAREYLSPPISNVAYKGILKASREVMRWFDGSTSKAREFEMAATFMERAGTGGALFRNLYRDFLKESCQLLQIEQLYTAYQAFVEIASLWTAVSELFLEVSANAKRSDIEAASEVLKTLSAKERQAMEGLTIIQSAG